MKKKFVKNSKDLEHQELLEEFKLWGHLSLAASLGLITNVLTMSNDIRTAGISVSILLISLSIYKITTIKIELKKIQDSILKL